MEQRFFLRSYPEDERQIIHLGIHIGLARSRIAPICFASRDKKMARQTPLFQLLQQGLKELVVSLCSNEDEEFYNLFTFLIHASISAIIWSCCKECLKSF